MKNFKKKIIAGISVACIIMSSFVNAFAYTPRMALDPDECNSIYYMAGSNPFQRNWSLAGGNCTWYAYGRAWELMGHEPTLSHNGAHKWYEYNDGYERGQEPRIGSVACWKSDDSTIGHVAIVEKVEGDNVTISESGWSFTKSYFSTRTLNKNNMSYGTGYNKRNFQGYIYLPIEDLSVPPVITGGTPEEKIEIRPSINISDIITYADQQPKSQSGIYIFINDMYTGVVSSDAAQYGNEVFVPARDFLEFLGGTVSWDDSTKTMTAKVRNQVFRAQLNSNIIYINDIPVKIRQRIIINSNGKMMIPLRASVTMLGGRILGVDSGMKIDIMF